MKERIDAARIWLLGMQEWEENHQVYKNVADLLAELQSRLEKAEKDAARWREVLTNDEFVVCDSSGGEYRKCKLEQVVDAMKD